MKSAAWGPRPPDRGPPRGTTLYSPRLYGKRWSTTLGTSFPPELWVTLPSLKHRAPEWLVLRGSTWHTLGYIHEEDEERRLYKWKQAVRGEPSVFLISALWLPPWMFILNKLCISLLCCMYFSEIPTAYVIKGTEVPLIRARLLWTHQY